VCHIFYVNGCRQCADGTCVRSRETDPSKYPASKVSEVRRYLTKSDKAVPLKLDMLLLWKVDLTKLGPQRLNCPGNEHIKSYALGSNGAAAAAPAAAPSAADLRTRYLRHNPKAESGLVALEQSMPSMATDVVYQWCKNPENAHLL